MRRALVWASGAGLVFGVLALQGCSKSGSRRLSPQEKHAEEFFNKEFAPALEAAVSDHHDSATRPTQLADLFSAKFEYNGMSSSEVLESLGVSVPVESAPPGNPTPEQLAERGSSEPAGESAPPRSKLPALEDLRFSNPLQVAPGTYRAEVTAAVLGKRPEEGSLLPSSGEETYKVSGTVEMVMREEGGASKIVQLRLVDITVRNESGSVPEASEVSIGGVPARPEKTARIKPGEKSAVEVLNRPPEGAKVVVEFNFESVGGAAPRPRGELRESVEGSKSAPRRQDPRSAPMIWQAPEKPGLYYLGVATVEKRPLNAKTYVENGIPMIVYESDPRIARSIRYITIPVQVAP